jgi:metal-dependent hydrolase (beta-lactamase superfamily II)
MKFTALPVKEGDSFLLETSGKRILVDTGKDENECRDFILKKEIDKLDLVIITHYDGDHVNGLLNLLKSKIIITEIWLPENFGRISKTLKQKENNILKRIFKSKEDINGIIIHSISNNNVRHIEIVSEIANETNKVISIFHYPSTEHKGYHKKCTKGIEDDIINLSQPESDILITYISSNHIRKINEIVEECGKKTNIRWLKYTGVSQNEKINKTINVLGLNSKENKNIIEYYDDLETILQLTIINRESLVFKYHYGKKPNILFSSDSGFEFLSGNQTIILNNKSLVTAAHHGSNDRLNVKTYSLVEGKNLIYIRSDKLEKSRPCCEYIQIEKKYCTICNNPPDDKKKEVSLNYKSQQWITDNHLCSCTREC